MLGSDRNHTSGNGKVFQKNRLGTDDGSMVLGGERDVPLTETGPGETGDSSTLGGGPGEKGE